MTSIRDGPIIATQYPNRSTSQTLDSLPVKLLFFSFESIFNDFKYEFHPELDSTPIQTK